MNNKSGETPTPQPFLKPEQDYAALDMEAWDKESHKLKQLTTPTADKQFFFSQDPTGAKFKISFDRGHDSKQTYARILRVTDKEIEDLLK